MVWGSLAAFILKTTTNKNNRFWTLLWRPQPEACIALKHAQLDSPSASRPLSAPTRGPSPLLSTNQRVSADGEERRKKTTKKKSTNVMITMEFAWLSAVHALAPRQRRWVPLTWSGAVWSARVRVVLSPVWIQVAAVSGDCEKKNLLVVHLTCWV